MMTTMTWIITAITARNVDNNYNDGYIDDVYDDGDNAYDDDDALNRNPYLRFHN